MAYPRQYDRELRRKLIDAGVLRPARPAQLTPFRNVAGHPVFETDAAGVAAATGPRVAAHFRDLTENFALARAAERARRRTARDA